MVQTPDELARPIGSNSPFPRKQLVAELRPDVEQDESGMHEVIYIDLFVTHEDTARIDWVVYSKHIAIQVPNNLPDDKVLDWVQPVVKYYEHVLNEDDMDDFPYPTAPRDRGTRQLSPALLDSRDNLILTTCHVCGQNGFASPKE